MVSRLVPVNGYVEEGTVNQIENSYVEVPQSQNASKVEIVYIELDLITPDTVTALYGETNNSACVCRGKIICTAATLSQNGAVTSKTKSKQQSNGAPYCVLVEGPDAFTPQVPLPVFRSGEDNKFYVTVALKGSNNTNKQKVYYHIMFLVED